MNYFVTGSDTGVGKTFFCSLWTQALRRAGFDTVALKPFCCGSRNDVEILQAAADGQLTLEEINPVWLATPASPYTASLIEGCDVPVQAAIDSVREICENRSSVIIEGVGGWLVPIQRNFLVADFAAAIGLPVVVVVANRLGCLNHTLLTIESITSRGLKCAGLVMNTMTEDASTRTNRRVLEDTCGVPILFELQPGQAQLELTVA